MKRIAIIDSFGHEPLHPKYTEILSHVTFDGFTPTQLLGQPRHGHAGWCAWDWASQSTEEIAIDFFRIFGENGKGSQEVWGQVFKAMRERGPYDYVSNSWGGNSAYDDRWLGEFMEACGDATIIFAASNDGRGTYAYPQRQLMDNPQTFIVGAIDSKGIRPEWSSTGKVGEQYVDFSMLGVGASLDGMTGEVVNWQGTSKADPNGGGMLCANGITWREADKFLRDVALRDDNFNGLPDGIEPDYEATIMSGGFHPDVGRGVCESARQDCMRKTGLGLAFATSVAGIKVEQTSQWLDFDRIVA